MLLLFEVVKGQRGDYRRPAVPGSSDSQKSLDRLAYAGDRIVQHETAPVPRNWNTDISWLSFVSLFATARTL